MIKPKKKDTSKKDAAKKDKKNPFPPKKKK